MYMPKPGKPLSSKPFWSIGKWLWLLFVKENWFVSKHNMVTEKPNVLHKVYTFYWQPSYQMHVCECGCAHTHTHMCVHAQPLFPNLWYFPSVSENESFQSFFKPFCFCEALSLYPVKAWQEAYVSCSSSWTRQLCFSHTTWENVPSLNQLAQGSRGAKYSLCHGASINVSISLFF